MAYQPLVSGNPEKPSNAATPVAGVPVYGGVAGASQVGYAYQMSPIGSGGVGSSIMPMYGGHPRSAYLPPLLDYSPCRSQPPTLWQTNMCDCFSDMALCCDVYWCSYCHMGYLYNKVKTGFYGPDWVTCGLVCFLDSIMLLGLGYVFIIHDSRRKVRARFNIDPESGNCSECCKVLCCPSLAACQVSRELTARGYFPGGFCLSNPPSYAMM